jgi:hypothetical protein
MLLFPLMKGVSVALSLPVIALRFETAEAELLPVALRNRLIVACAGFALKDPLAETVMRDWRAPVALHVTYPTKRNTNASIAMTNARYCLLKYRFTSVLAMVSIVYAIALF